MIGYFHYWKSLSLFLGIGTLLYFCNVGWLACFFWGAFVLQVLEAAVFSAIIEAKAFIERTHHD